MKRILIDLDGTIVNTMGEAFEMGLLDHYPCRWNFPGCCSSLTMDEFFAHTDMFAVAKPIEGALQGVADLIADGLDVHFVSTPWPSNHKSAKAKYDWIEQHFGDPTMLTLTHHKALIPADALIDDKPGLVGPWRVVTYPQDWNDSVFPSWSGGLAQQVIKMMRYGRYS